MQLTKRQLNEIEFYRKYYKTDCDFFKTDFDVDFSPILLDTHRERRPWNAYWKFYEIIYTYYSKNKSRKLRILDFGCGAGHTTVMYRKLGFDEVYAFDISKDGIEEAKKTEKRYFGKPEIKFSVQCAEGLDYPDNFFDAVFGLDILHHTDIDKAAEQLRRIIKKDGLMIFKEELNSKIFDFFRQSKIFNFLISSSKSHKYQITKDEHKITEKDLKLLKNRFNFIKIMHYTLLDRAPKRSKFLLKYQKIIQKVDFRILRDLLFLRSLAGSGIIILKNPRKSG